MMVDILFTKGKKTHNVHKLLKTLFVLVLSQNLKSKFNIDKLKYTINHWTYPGVFLSASHCQNNVIVAISKKPLGIDLEQINNPLLNIQMWKRIVTKEEKKKYHSNYSKIKLLKLWTRKEAIYKMLGTKYFVPNKINTLDFNVKTYSIDKKFICSIATHV